MNTLEQEVAISNQDGHDGLRQRIRRLRGRIDREGLGSIAVEAARRILRPLVDRIDLVYIELGLDNWKPKLGRRGRETEFAEVRLEELSRWQQLLGETEARFARDQLERGSRIFIAIRSAKLAGVVAAARRYQDPELAVVCEVGPVESILFRVSVMQEFRRGATGGVLVEHVLSTLAAEGFARVVGVIRSSNRPSLVLSENLGYRQYQRQRIYRFFSRFTTSAKTIEGAKAEFSGRATIKARKTGAE